MLVGVKDKEIVRVNDSEGLNECMGLGLTDGVHDAVGVAEGVEVTSRVRVGVCECTELTVPVAVEGV